jgi:hypothetical protein
MAHGEWNVSIWLASSLVNNYRIIVPALILGPGIQKWAMKVNSSPSWNYGLGEIDNKQSKCIEYASDIKKGRWW